jgi:hypothetical protein
MVDKKSLTFQQVIVLVYCQISSIAYPVLNDILLSLFQLVIGLQDTIYPYCEEHHYAV